MTGVVSPSVGFGATGEGGIDAVELSPVFEQAGTRYFVCSLPRHCLSGMKIAVKIIDVACPKCAVSLNSRKPSCCAPGGAWFRNCGENDDPEFDHTWFEGVQACERKFAIDSIRRLPLNVSLCRNLYTSSCSYFAPMSPDAVTTITADTGTLSTDKTATSTIDLSKCPMCGIQESSGKRSCCFPLGSWYNACGVSGDTNFQHTWYEGLEACRGKAFTTST